MILHLGFELPEPAKTELNHEISDLTSEEVRIIKEQIRKNSFLIGDFVNRLDLFLNKEKYPAEAAFVGKIRSRLLVLMEENDTFRKVLWKHFQRENCAQMGAEE